MPLFNPCPISGEGFVLDANTLFLWHFDEATGGDYLNLADAATGARTLTAASITVAPKITNGKNGLRYARICDGVEDVMTRAGDAASRTLLQSAAWTVEMFIRVDAFPASLAGAIGYGKSGDLLADNVQMNFSFTPTGKLDIRWENGAGVDIIMTQAAGGALALDTWMHAAAVKSGGNILFYLDGVLQDTVAYPSEPDGGTDAAVSWRFGANINNVSTLFGAFAAKSIRISDIARSAATIAADAALLNTTMTHPVDANTFICWQCNEAPDAIDESARGMHLAANSAGVTHGEPGLIGAGKSKFFNGSAQLQAPQENDPNAEVVRQSILADCTFECWFRVLDNNAAIRGIFSFGDPAAADIEANNIYAAEYQVATPRSVATRWEQGAGVDVNFAPGTLVPANEEFGKHYLAITKDTTGGTAVVEIYLDGVLFFTSGALTNFTGGTGVDNYLRLGLGQSNAAWAGQMDEIRWSNVKRSAAEILAAYNAGI